MTAEEQAALARLVQTVDLRNFQPSPMPAPFPKTNADMLTGLGNVFALLPRFSPQNYAPQQSGDQWWIPQSVSAQEIPANTNATWGPIEDATQQQQKIADELGPVGKKILDSPLTTGDWW